MNREVVDALLRLFDERFAENFPRNFIALAADFFERLINRHRADGNGAVAQNPLARGVNVFSRGKIHERVAAPTAGPTHFVHFFFDAGRDRGVPDVRVDFHEKISSDNHRFGFRVIDVCGKNCATARDFRTHEFRRNFLRDRRAESFSRVHKIKPTALRRSRVVAHFLQLHIFADRDKFHFRRDDSAARVIHLRNVRAGLCAVNFAVAAVKLFDVASAFHFGNDVARGNALDIAAFENPRRAQGGKPLANVLVKRFVAPRSGRVVDADGRVFANDFARAGTRRRKGNFAHGHTNIGAGTLDVDAATLRERVADFVVFCFCGNVCHVGKN